MNLIDVRYVIEGEAEDVIQAVSGGRNGTVSKAVHVTVGRLTRGIGREHGFRDAYSLPVIENGDAGPAFSMLDNLERQASFRPGEYEEIKDALVRLVRLTK